MPRLRSRHAGAGGQLEMTAVRVATHADAAALDHVLSAAFFDDPLNEWLLPDGGRRAAALRRGMGHVLRVAYLPHGSAWTTADLDGIALWAKPEDPKPSTLEQLRGLPTFVSTFRSRLPRAMRAFDTVEERRPSEPHFFLDMVAVRPDRQGRGVGSALIRAGTDQADAVGAPAFLATASPRNLPLYERHGFDVSEQVEIGPVRVWTMLRRAQT